MRYACFAVSAALMATAGCGGGKPAGHAQRAHPSPAGEQPVVTSPSPRDVGTVPLRLRAGFPHGARDYVDPLSKVRAELPLDWRRARRNLTPALAPPGAILAVGNSPLRRTPEAACSRAPDHPQLHVGRRDALVLVVEDVHGRADLAPRRPRRFRLREQAGRRAAAPGRRIFPWRCLNRPGIVGLWTFFGEHRRLLYVTAVAGESTSAGTRRETLAVVNSLRFGER